jgi:hypothetical protein
MRELSAMVFSYFYNQPGILVSNKREPELKITVRLNFSKFSGSAQ